MPACKLRSNVALSLGFYSLFPAGMFKVNNRNTRTRCEICSKLTIMTNDANDVVLVVFNVNFEHISHLVLVFLLSTLSR